MSKEDCWPILAVKTCQGGWFYHDVSDGNRHATGEGWLCCLPWGEARKNFAWHGDNRVSLEHEDCVEVHLLGWTRSMTEYEQEYGYPCKRLIISVEAK